ncbi:MAG TPA: septal ring lytic transglycosylase RlpA family protein, partial [Arenimonas sp.]|uniref:septal ring lytic transglycosylase RlpA family protein n=1 Tax=Arenimonas sp. TaxID=1872635 RepID=UPI002C68AEC9
RYGNRSPYSVLGKSYRVLDSANGYVERGTASWYGNKFNGRATSSGEIYDICSFTAAHKTLPLPSFARVTNLDNGRSVIVRVNDRGPFHEGRIIDLSYAAAVRLGVDRTGTARVEVRAISVGDGPVDAPVETATPALPAPVIAAPPSVSAPASPTPSSPSSSSSSSSSSASALPSASPAATPVEGDNPSPSAPAAAADDEQRILQVGSFASQDNARRLADKLITAGIADVVIDSGEANGQPVWRVRIGPAELDALPALVDKIRALGLPSPRVFSE